MQSACKLRSQIKTNAEVYQEPGAENGSLQIEDASHAHPVVRKLEWESKRATRDLQGLTVTVMCLLLEDLPMVVPCRCVLPLHAEGRCCYRTK